METTINYTEKAIASIRVIGEKEPEFLVAVAETLGHLEATYADKYEASKNLLDTKQQMYNPFRGMIIIAYQISRYLQRFMSEGFAKSANKNDLHKIIHYSLFGVVNMNRQANIKNIDIVDGKPNDTMSDSEFKQINVGEEAEK